MPDDKYNVVFQGQLVDGRSVDEVTENFCKRFSLSEEQVRGILGKRRFVLKRDVDEAKGASYIRVFGAIGMQVAIEPVSASAAALQAAHTAPIVTQSQPSNDTNGESGGGNGGESTQEGEDTDHGDTPREIEFQFHGDGGEYFKVWIVNVLLTIVTLGLYSPWAKVRNKRYFYGNTEIDGSSFEYVASPMAIFKGRMLAALVFFVYYLISNFMPIAGLILSVGLLFVLPWAIIRSFAFNAINSVYRNVRFKFEGTYPTALLAFVVFPILALVTFGLLAPYAYYKQVQFFYNGHRFGTCPFKTEVNAKDVYMMFLVVIGLTICVGLVLGVFSALIPPLAIFAGLIVYLCFFVLFAVRSTNLRYNYLGLGKNGFTAAFDVSSYGALFVTNTLGIVFTLGLFTPWAKVRTARYKANRIGYLAVTDTNAFVEDQQEQVKAIGEEFAEMFDWDFGF